MSKVSVERNRENLRELLDVIRNRHTDIFMLRSLLRKHKHIKVHSASHFMPHLVNAGLVEIYSFSIIPESGFKRNITYRRCFDGSVDIDKCMKDMIKNEMQVSRNGVPHLR